MKRRGLTFKALALAVLACSTGAALAAKTLVYCSEGSPEGFNPQFFTHRHDVRRGRRCRCSTGWSSSRSARPTSCPALAESWTVAPDGLTYTFKLRKGVKFHSNAKFKPTRDFNADDVLFSCNRMADAEPPVRTKSPPARPTRTSTTWA